MRQPLRSARIPALAILACAVAAEVYRAFVFSQFAPVRLEGISAELHSTRHIVTTPLPDLSPLRGQAAVLGLRLENTRSQQRQIGVLREGFPRRRVGLPPHRTTRWEIVLPSETVQAFDNEAGEGARMLELTGDADGWALTGLEVRNYHIRAGDRLMVVVPARDAAHAAAPGVLPVSIVLCVLALLTALAPRSRGPWRLVTIGLALAAFLVCLTCLLLPRFSPYKVLLSPSLFAVVVAGLFSPALSYATPSFLRNSTAVVAGRWKRHDQTFERGAALLGLVAIAIAQPIFEVVSNSPEFFAARGTTAATAISAILAICLGLPFVLLGIERTVRAGSPNMAAMFHGVVLALLSAAVVMPWIRRGEALTSPWDALLGVFAGVAVSLAAFRSRTVRQFLTALAPAAVVVPAVFLLDPGIKQNMLPSASVASVQAIERTPPIVFVVFDELPLNSLLTPEGTIDAERYPNFSAFVRDAHWFRNASTVAANTVHALPAILSGRYPTTVNEAPTLKYYPVNLFTTLARHYAIFASLRFQKLCPPRVCQDNSALPADTVRSLLSDLGLVWLHIVLPRPLAEELPTVTEDWAEFGQVRETQTRDARDTRGDVFARFMSSIDGQPARLYFIHSMVPHMPFEYVPSGRRYRRLDSRPYRGLFEGMSAAYTDALYQRHLAQVGYVDRLVGELVGRLRAAGVYDQALIIITSDHGASYRENRSRRRLQPQRNLSDVLRVPLMMKLPGQRQGEVVDRIVETVDVLPTILDVVGAKSSLRLDGRSLIDGRLPPRSSRTFIVRNQRNVAARSIGDWSADRAASLGNKERRFGRGDVIGLYAPPSARHLLGMHVDRAAIHAARDVQITIRNPRQFEAVNLASDPLPLYVAGSLNTGRSEPLTIAVVVNGIVAAVTGSFLERGAHVFGTLIPETSLRAGDNSVVALAVAGDSPVR